MFWDVLFSILFVAVVLYLVIDLIYDMREFEWSVVKWVKRIFKLCNHHEVKKYSVGHYYADGPKEEYPRVAYNIMCDNCDTVIGQYIVPVKSILDLNLKTTVDGEWYTLTEEEFAILKKFPHHNRFL